LVNGSKIEVVFLNNKKMRKIFLYIAVTIFFVACNGGKQYSNEEADTRKHNQQTKTEGGATGTITQDDTTSTTNNSAYNTDSASGQGTVFDSSSSNKK
jgi:hypothetical protein